jgi:DNA-binding MarR family transcriptional regulator
LSNQLLSTQELATLTAWARLLRGHAGVRRSVSAQLHANDGLTINEYEALLLLSHAEDNHMRRVDIAEGLQLTASGVTRLLDGLRERGFVERTTCSSDARVAYAVLTDLGRVKLEDATGSHVAGIRALFEERYTTTEIEALSELLARLPGAGGADGASCTP